MALNKTKFADLARDRFKEANTFWHNWRSCAVDDFGFVSGKQWLDLDEAILREQRRPPITFNYSEKIIDAVIGAEVSNRQEVTYRPRGVEDSGLAELYNNAAKWVRDECSAEDEESDSFKDMLVCGLGWTTTRLSYDEDQDGKLIIERIDPLEMRSDPAANKPGLTDRRYAYRTWWVDERDAKSEWPEATFTSEEETNTANGVIIRGQRYNDDGDEENEAERHKGQVLLTLYECVEREPMYRVSMDGKIQEIPPEVFSRMQAAFDEAGIQYVKQYKRVYYRGFFAGDTLLEAALSPCQDGFTFQAITGKRDRNKNTWYGLTRVMKDPQRWANKWLSQILHIINSNAKGGLMAEVNAFVDPQKAQDEWAQPDSITLFKEGALSGGKVQQKQMPPFPAGLDRLMQFALGSLPQVTGVNLEALGLADREQAGVLEAQRKQAAYGLLAPIFDALRRYRKNQGKVLLYMMNTFISDGRMIRIGGPESQQFMPLRKLPDNTRYDIIVDSSPNAPDVKERTWETLMQLVPSLLKAGLPLPPDLLDFSPLPVALVAKWKQFAEQSKQPDPKTQQQLQQMQQELQKLAQENQSLKADQQNEQAQLQLKAQQAQAELMLKKQSQEADITLKREEAIANLQLEQLKQEQDFELEKRHLAQDFAMKSMLNEKAAGTDAGKVSTIAEKMDNLKELFGKLDTVTEKLDAPEPEPVDNTPLILQSIQQLAQTLTRPRKLVVDANGKPIGSELVNSLPTPQQ